MRALFITSLFTTAACASSAPVAPAAPPLPAVQGTASLAAPMAKLAFMRGVWVGPATGTTRTGPYKVTQTERMGPMLGGDIVVIEGRGYKDDQTTGFNAFAVASYNPQTSKYELRSYAQGYAGTFELRLSTDGYVWEVPAGPNAITRFTAVVKDNTWHEVGELVTESGAPKQIFEMTLKKVSDTDWPLGTPVSPALAR